MASADGNVGGAFARYGEHSSRRRAEATTMQQADAFKRGGRRQVLAGARQLGQWPAGALPPSLTLRKVSERHGGERDNHQQPKHIHIGEEGCLRASAPALRSIE